MCGPEVENCLPEEGVNDIATRLERGGVWSDGGDLIGSQPITGKVSDGAFASRCRN